MKRIAPLPETLVGRIRGDTHIAGLGAAVAECVANSLDAGTTNISVAVDARELSFTVTDDGAGIRPDCMATIGRRFATSKLASLAELQAGISTLGFKGEALASLADAAVVSVTSRASGEFETWTKVLKPGSVLQCGVAAESRPRPGTTVAVRNFLFNQPVRQQRLLANGCVAASYSGGCALHCL